MKNEDSQITYNYNFDTPPNYNINIRTPPGFKGNIYIDDKLIVPSKIVFKIKSPWLTIQYQENGEKNMAAFGEQDCGKTWELTVREIENDK